MVKINKTLQLYDCFERWANYDSIFILSDTHFGDLDLYKSRYPEAFDSDDNVEDIIKRLDQDEIKRINSKVGKTSLLILLGDVGDIECVKKLRAGYKVLILGNHDVGASNYKRNTYCVVRNKSTGEVINKEKITNNLNSRYYSNIINSVTKDFDLNVQIEDNHLFDEVYEGPLQIAPKILLSHEPINPCTYALNIHGHIHVLGGAKNINDIYHLNVNVDSVDGIPQNLTKIVENGYLKDIDDIHRQTIDRATKKKEKKEKIIKPKGRNVDKFQVLDDFDFFPNN